MYLQTWIKKKIQYLKVKSKLFILNAKCYTIFKDVILFFLHVLEIIQRFLTRCWEGKGDWKEVETFLEERHFLWANETEIFLITCTGGGWTAVPPKVAKEGGGIWLSLWLSKNRLFQTSPNSPISFRSLKYLNSGYRKTCFEPIFHVSMSVESIKVYTSFREYIYFSSPMIWASIVNVFNKNSENKLVF